MLGEQILTEDVSVSGFVPETNTDNGAASDDGTVGSSILMVKSYLSPMSALSRLLDPVARLITVSFHAGFESVKVVVKPVPE